MTISSRHNQILSLLTEIDDTNINKNSSFQSTTLDDTNKIEIRNVPEENNDEKTLSFEDNTSHVLLSMNEPSRPDSSDNSTLSSSDVFSDSASDSSKKTNSSSSDNDSREESLKYICKENRKPRYDKKLCCQAPSMIKFLGTIGVKKLDLKHELRLRMIAF